MRISKKVTLTPGTPLQVSQLFGYNPTFTANNWPGGMPMICDRICIQMLQTGTGVGYVFDGIPHGTLPTVAGTPNAQLFSADAGGPGGQYAPALTSARRVDASARAEPTST